MNFWQHPLFRRSVLAFFVLGFILLGASFVHRMFFAPPIDSRLVHEDLRVGKEEAIQIEIKNASGVSGIARRAMDYFRLRGFDVVDISNNGEEVEQSYVCDRVGDSLSARKVAYALGVEESRIEYQTDSTLYVQCTVILGKDFQQSKPFK